MIKEYSGTPEAFYKHLKAVTLSDPDGEDAVFLNILLAAVDYPVFIQMMREVAQEQRALRK